MAQVRLDETKRVALISSHRDINEVLGDISGERFRLYRQMWESATQCNLVSDYPLDIDFEFNYYCNLRCRSCLLSLPKEKRGPEPTQKDFPFEKAKDIILEGVPLGLRALEVAYYGEPLLRKEIIEFCNWAADNGIVDIIFHTNAVLLAPKVSEEILDSKITKFRISLDAYSKNLYEKIRRGAKYDIVHKNIMTFLEKKKQRGQVLPLTSTNFVLMEINEHEVEDFKNYWQDKVDFVAIQNMVNLDQGNLKRARSHSVSTNFRCPQPFQRVTIRSDGTVLPCCSPFAIESPLGNVFEQSLKDMWNSERMNLLRSIMKEGTYYQEPMCRKCANQSTAT